jgi:hypothetical protein
MRGIPGSASIRMCPIYLILFPLFVTEFLYKDYRSYVIIHLEKWY